MRRNDRVILISARRVGAMALAAAVIAGACTSATTPAPTATPGGQASAGPGGATTPTVPTGNVVLTGTGATFPVPIYDVWNDAFNYKYKNIQIDYKGIGSGGGIKAITEQTVDFGASDAALTDSAMGAIKSGLQLLHFPTVLGAVVIIYNLPNVSLQLDAANVADIYLGKITNWNDPKLAANNTGQTLPDKPIKVVRRSDGSGTTNAFTTYLDTVSAEWKAQVGRGTEVKWPVGVGAAGNDGVAGAVRGVANEGAVGYVELNYATTAKLSAAKLRNAAGKFVAGSTAGVTAAAEGALATFPADFRQAPIISGAGEATYPIASYTYLLVYQDQSDVNKGQALVAYLHWALTDGQGTTGGLGYARLPDSIRQRAIDQLHTITTGGKAIWGM
jgi:phosphate transport system substrate-binding protein